MACQAETPTTSRCSEPERTGVLPESLPEISGVAVSRSTPGLLWVHEDSGRPATLSAIDTAGNLLGQVRVVGADNVDWEDIAIGPCPSGECIYLADTGDNLLERTDPVLYRVPEPTLGDTLTPRAEVFPIRYPGGPRDVEALFLLPDGTPYLISKGRRHPIELYRYPLPLRPGEVVTLEEVERLTGTGAPLPGQVTGADAAPDGRWIAVRGYSWLRLYRPGEGGRLVPLSPAPGLSLQGIAEPQGEGVGVRDDGTIFLVSESGPKGVPGTVSRLECLIESH